MGGPGSSRRAGGRRFAMAERRVVVGSKVGLHARPAAMFVQAAAKQPVKVTIAKASGGHPFVLVALDLAPADTATLDAERVRAIITEEGGPTSHTAILAKSLGIPAVVTCRGATAIAEGETVLVDGTEGTVAVAPDQAAVQD